MLRVVLNDDCKYVFEFDMDIAAADDDDGDGDDALSLNDCERNMKTINEIASFFLSKQNGTTKTPKTKLST